MDDGVFYCNWCYDRLDKAVLFIHGAKCLRKRSLKELGFVICTCCDGMVCQNTQRQPGNQILAQPTVEHNRPATIPSYEKFLIPIVIQDSLDEAQRTGRWCILYHDGIKNGSAMSRGLPEIRVGRHRKYQLCVKKHLTNQEHVEQIIRMLDKEIKDAIENGDAVITNQLLRRSDGADFTEFTEDQTCSGIPDISSIDKCDADCSSILWILHKDEPLYFCKPSHLLRHMLQYHCQLGKKSKNKETEKQEKAKRKEKKDKEKADAEAKKQELKEAREEKKRQAEAAKKEREEAKKEKEAAKKEKENKIAQEKEQTKRKSIEEAQTHGYNTRKRQKIPNDPIQSSPTDSMSAAESLSELGSSL
eukprot:TRINITY_DN5055_c0_g1_i1.p1 TRINITY_DN5055_c0_g1~~TRINITY_DN5055_c0_g1_i1.p1  ORF type:complete len:370 (+),score=77.47 TRINITY_DN5055_c0_g1_i1:32-1111(+)